MLAIRVRSRIERWVLKRTFKNITRALIALARTLRLELEDDENIRELIREAKDRSKILRVASLKLCKCLDEDDYVGLATDHHTHVNDVIASAMQLPAVRASIVLALRLHHLQYSEHDRFKAEHYWREAQQLDADVKVLAHTDLAPLIRRLRHVYRATSHERTQRRLLKIDLKLGDLGYLVSIFATAFLVSGYLTNSYLLAHFGVTASHYFTLGDYLASSIANIRYAAIGGAIATIGFFLGFRSSMADADGRTNVDDTLESISVFLSGIMLTGLTVVAFIKDLPGKFAYMSMLLGFLGMWGSRTIAGRFFTRPVPATFILVFVSTYAAGLFYTVNNRIHEIDKKDLSGLKRTRFYFHDEVQADESSLFVLTANGSYFFLLDKNTNVVTIVPKQMVKRTESIRDGSE